MSACGRVVQMFSLNLSNCKTSIGVFFAKCCIAWLLSNQTELLIVFTCYSLALE